MRLSSFLSGSQVETIHRNALRVLAEVGVLVEHEEVAKRLRSVGGEVDESGRVRFPSTLVERALQDRTKEAPVENHPKVSVFSGIYQCQYLDPISGAYLPFDRDKLAFYLALAASLPGMGDRVLLGMPFEEPGIPISCGPLLEKVYCWRYGAVPGGAVQLSELCEPLLDLFECHASWSGRPLREVFAACGYMLSPLRLARVECEQLLFFAKHDCRMNIGHQPNQGGTAPITLAGVLTLSLAEQIFLFLLHSAFYENAPFELNGGVTTTDPRNVMAVYGRPEKQRVNAAFADIAQFYGCPCRGHSGLSDAKVPTTEAGAQKAIGALLTALALGEGFIEAGLLSIDEVCSPVQMILDYEIAKALSALLAEPTINDIECAFDEIAGLKAGEGFFGTELSASRCRTEMFLPKTWSKQSLSGWLRTGCKVDTDYARDWIASFNTNYCAGSLLSDAEERELSTIISKAARGTTAVI